MSRKKKKNRRLLAEPVAEPIDLDARHSQTPTQRVSASISAFKGPLPPPELLERYNQIVPNGADRIVAMAESLALATKSELEIESRLKSEDSSPLETAVAANLQDVATKAAAGNGTAAEA